MTTAELCAVCGGVLETKTVEHLLKGGTNTASILVTADVCSRCGERYFNMEVARSLEAIRHKLLQQEFSHLKNVGQSFTVAEDWPDKVVQPTRS